MTPVGRAVAASLSAVLSVAALAGCSDQPDPELDTGVTTAASLAPTATETVDTAGDAQGDDDVRGDNGADDDADADAPASGRSVLPGLPELALVTAPSNDQRPLLEWEPVPGAEVYSVSVHTPDGLGYWAWRTDATSVHLGGDPRLRNDVSGPSTVSGMTWSVIAFDAARLPIAASIRAVLRP
jgi:hypothetical protein